MIDYMLLWEKLYAILCEEIDKPNIFLKNDAGVLEAVNDLMDSLETEARGGDRECPRK